MTVPPATETRAPEPEGDDDTLTNYYRSLFPAAGDLAVAEMVRLYRDHKAASRDFFRLYCAGMGIEPDQFQGLPAGQHPADLVAGEREKLLDELREMRLSRDKWYSEAQAARNQQLELERQAERAQAAANEWRTRLGRRERELLDLAYEAWTVIANAGHVEGKPQAGWVNEHPHWQIAATRWRDRLHAELPTHVEPGDVPARRSDPRDPQPRPGDEDAEIEAADDREPRRTGGTFVGRYLGPQEGATGG